MTSFAAGMLLSISLIHIMPEAASVYKEYKHGLHEAEEAAEAAALLASRNAVKVAGQTLRRLLNELDPHDEDVHDEDESNMHADEEEAHISEGFPLPNVIFFFGFMLMLLLDQVAFKDTKLISNKSKESADATKKLKESA